MKPGYSDQFKVCSWFGLAAFAVGIQVEVAAQGTFNGTVLRTGSGQPLVSAVLPLPPFGSNPSSLEFRFGFATDEVFGPGKIFDSFTITLQDDARRSTLVVLTADAGGVVWAPVTPGGLSLDPASITRATIPFPSLQPVLANQVAYLVTLPVPAQFDGLSAKVHLDLFDNLDPARSLGFAELAVTPEPACWELLLVCAGLIWLFQRAWHK